MGVELRYKGGIEIQWDQGGTESADPSSIMKNYWSPKKNKRKGKKEYLSVDLGKRKNDIYLQREGQKRFEKLKINSAHGVSVSLPLPLLFFFCSKF